MDRRWKEWKNNFGITGVVAWNPLADGNCLFSSISEAVDPHLKCTIDHLRYYAALQIMREDKESVEIMITNYRIEVEKGDFKGRWDPTKCTTAAELSDAIIAPVHTRRGFDFQGDSIILSMLSKILQLDIIVFEQEKSSGYSCLGGDDEKKNLYTIFLLRENKNHYQALGVCKGEDSVQSLFESDNLPPTFRNYLDKQDKKGREHEKLSLRKKLESKSLKC